MNPIAPSGAEVGFDVLTGVVGIRTSWDGAVVGSFPAVADAAPGTRTPAFGSAYCASRGWFGTPFERRRTEPLP